MSLAIYIAACAFMFALAVCFILAYNGQRKTSRDIYKASRQLRLDYDDLLAEYKDLMSRKTIQNVKCIHEYQIQEEPVP